MQRLGHYSVQRINDDERPEVFCVTVEAASALQAAESVLGESLALRGDNRKPRAVVWSLGDDYTASSVTLYSSS